MDTADVLKAALEAVDKAGIPPELREVAFREAVGLLGSPKEGSTPGGPSPKTKRPTGTAKKTEAAATDAPSTDDFFASLAKESGADEDDLRDVLQLTNDGTVRVATPSKDLGSTVTEQARNVIALVSAARAKGLGENPVNAEQVRKEAKRKHCYQQNNFASFHLRHMKGFNALGKDEIVLASKWVGEFTTAVNKAQGKPAKKDKEED